VGTFILAAAIAGCASYNTCPGAGCTSDANTTEAVDAAIVAETDLGPPNQVEVSTYNHVVYLTGIVDSEYQREIAETIAAQRGGGAKVVNTIGLSN
jgi:osmotically-inducible protein OsmY